MKSDQDVPRSTEPIGMVEAMLFFGPEVQIKVGQMGFINVGKVTEKEGVVLLAEDNRLLINGDEEHRRQMREVIARHRLKQRIES